MDYHGKLKRSYWDKNKGAIAKAAGETGMGAAMEAAEKAFEKIAWDAINAKPPGQQDYTPKKWQEALDAAEKACESQAVVQTRLLLLDVESTAEDTVKKFKDSKLKMLISKSDVARTEEIGKLAKELRASLDPDKLKSTLVTPRFELVKKQMEAFSESYVKILKTSLANATKVASDMLKNPTATFFNSQIQLGARGVHTQLSKAPTMSMGTVDLNQAAELTKVSKPWADGAVKVDTGDEMKAEYAKFVKFLRDTNTLIAHH